MLRSNLITFSALLTATVVGVVNPRAARADTIPISSLGGISTESLGAFNGTISFGADAFSGGADLAITLTNTSPAANGGYITGFVFNIADVPDGSLSVSYIAQGASDKFTSMTDASASPFGTFEFGAAIDGSFLGGGSPNSGVAFGQTRQFLFELANAGENTAGLSANSFVTNNLPGGTIHPFAVRFRGFLDDSSDKVVAGVVTPPQIVPVPAAVWGGAVLLGALGLTKRLRRPKDTDLA